MKTKKESKKIETKKDLDKWMKKRVDTRLQAFSGFSYRPHEKTDNELLSEWIKALEKRVEKLEKENKEIKKEIEFDKRTERIFRAARYGNWNLKN